MTNSTIWSLKDAIPEAINTFRFVIAGWFLFCMLYYFYYLKKMNFANSSFKMNKEMLISLIIFLISLIGLLILNHLGFININ